MDNVIEILLILVSTIFVTNFVLARFLGICPFLGVSSRIETSIGMGMAVVFVITLAGICSWLIDKFVLIPLDIVYLRTIVFILVIAALVQFVEMVIRKTSPALYNALGIFLPLITTNCAVLAVALLVVQNEMDFFPHAFLCIWSSCRIYRRIAPYGRNPGTHCSCEDPKGFAGYTNITCYSRD